ncbi:MAG TPA: helix-turn-helix domain-containing protein [Mycobacteriales bacterium]|nr:helix-turn-helix domain-containing protein [Mycobacteriales bacterium]
MATLPKSKRIVGESRTQLADRLKAEYERGAPIRSLAESTGRSFGFVHTLLLEAGAELRQRGGSRPRRPSRR